MGIKFKCNDCGKTVEFPDTPNADTDPYQKIAFGIYSTLANIGLCQECEKARKENKEELVHNYA